MDEIILTWFQLELIVKSFLSRNSKVILNKINGYIEVNTMTALMGASGSGKSTLLKCLSGINREGLTSTSKIVFSSAQPMSVCFIFEDQNSYLHKQLTVKQSLIYSSKLKNSDQNIGVNHENNVSNLLIEFLLTDIRDNKVKDCSGGELKRLAIAQELTLTSRKPNILFIDEPTTGLDSNASDIVIKCLHKLTTKYKMSVLTSIHQPNSDLLQMFDKLYVLGKEGKCLYFGRPSQLRDHLIDCDITWNQNESPIEVLLKLSSMGFRDKGIKRLIDKTSDMNQLSNNEKLKGSTSLMTTYCKSFHFKDIYYLLMRRFQINFIIQWKTLLIETVFHLLFVVLISHAINENHWKLNGCFQQSMNLSEEHPLNMNCLEEEQNKMIVEQNIYLLYITSFIFMLTTISITTKNLITEMESFSVELKNHWFSTVAYFFSKSIIDSIPIIVNSILQSIVICYYSQRIEEHFRFFYYSLIFTICMLCSQSFGTIVGLVFIKNQQLAVMASMASYIVLTFFNNFIIPTKELVWIFQLFSELTFPKHVFNSILVIFYGMDRCEANTHSRVLFDHGINDSDLFYAISFSILILTVFKHIELILLIIVSNWPKIQMNLTNLFKTEKMEISNTRNTRIDIDKIAMDKILELYLNEERLHENDNHKNQELTLRVQTLLKQKLLISWIGLTFSLKSQKKEKVILNNLNGIVKFQTIMALMGPSGAGKTTLLKCINGQNNWGLSENSTIYLSKDQRIRSCFIKQNISDHLVNGLTVRQTLIYASKLKNSAMDIQIDHKLIANQLMDELLISDIRDTNTCDCSQGELKRIVIASELMAVNKPNMLCIDEPTSGLDSNAAQVIITCLKRLTRTHLMSIITTIHQPNNELFQQFDSIYILSKGGLHIYSGPPQELETHLKESNITCTEFQYPFEVILRIASNDSDENISELSKINETVKQYFLLRKEEVVKSNNGLIQKPKTFSFINFWHLLVRNIICSYVYEWKSLIIQIILYILLAINLSNLYKRQISLVDGCVDKKLFMSPTACNNTEDSLREESLLKQNIQYNLSFITGTSFIQIIITTMTFTSKVNVFLNEHKNCWYSTGAYFWAKSVVDSIPILFALMIFSHIINYYESFDMYLVYVYCLSLTVLCAQTIGHLSGIIFSTNTTIAVFVSVTFYLISSNLSNIFIPLSDFHYIFRILSDLSFLKHSINCILLKIYGFGRCPQNQFSLVLFKYNINEDMFNESLLNLILILVILKCLTLFILILKTNSFYSNDHAIKVTNKEMVQRTLPSCSKNIKLRTGFSESLYT